jgi:hypothetical protein
MVGDQSARKQYELELFVPFHYQQAADNVSLLILRVPVSTQRDKAVRTLSKSPSLRAVIKNTW